MSRAITGLLVAVPIAVCVLTALLCIAVIGAEGLIRFRSVK